MIHGAAGPGGLVGPTFKIRSIIDSLSVIIGVEEVGIMIEEPGVELRPFQWLSDVKTFIWVSRFANNTKRLNVIAEGSCTFLIVLQSLVNIPSLFFLLPLIAK